ncbi:MAG: ribbon-helix-helix domain-containing protein [Candidatus Brocadiales bacterium]
MGIPFNVYLPPELYKDAKELSQRDGAPISFMIREGLRLVLEKRRQKEGVENLDKLSEGI